MFTFAFVFVDCVTVAYHQPTCPPTLVDVVCVFNEQNVEHEGRICLEYAPTSEFIICLGHSIAGHQHWIELYAIPALVTIKCLTPPSCRDWPIQARHVCDAHTHRQTPECAKRV